MRVRMKNLMGLMEGGSIPALSNLEQAMKTDQKVTANPIYTIMTCIFWQVQLAYIIDSYIYMLICRRAFAEVWIVYFLLLLFIYVLQPPPGTARRRRRSTTRTQLADSTTSRAPGLSGFGLGN